MEEEEDGKERSRGVTEGRGSEGEGRGEGRGGARERRARRGEEKREERREGGRESGEWGGGGTGGKGGRMGKGGRRGAPERGGGSFEGTGRVQERRPPKRGEVPFARARVCAAFGPVLSALGGGWGSSPSSPSSGGARPQSPEGARESLGPAAPRSNAFGRFGLAGRGVAAPFYRHRQD